MSESDDKVKRTYRFSIQIKDCERVFKDGMRPGELLTVDHTYELEQRQFDRPMFAMHLLDISRELRDEYIDVVIEEVKDDNNG